MVIQSCFRKMNTTSDVNWYFNILELEKVIKAESYKVIPRKRLKRKITFELLKSKIAFFDLRCASSCKNNFYIVFSNGNFLGTDRTIIIAKHLLRNDTTPREYVFQSVHHCSQATSTSEQSPFFTTLICNVLHSTLCASQKMTTNPRPGFIN